MWLFRRHDWVFRSGIDTSEQKLTQALYAATDLMTKLGTLNVANHKLSGTFLSYDSPSSDIPLVFDTGCGFSVTPCIDDFSSPPEPSQPITAFLISRTIELRLLQLDGSIGPFGMHKVDPQLFEPSATISQKRRSTCSAHSSTTWSTSTSTTKWARIRVQVTSCSFVMSMVPICCSS